MPSVEHREAKTYLEVLKKPADSNPICLPGNLICLVVKNTKMPEGWKNSTEKSKPASTETEHHQTTTTVGTVQNFFLI